MKTFATVLLFVITLTIFADAKTYNYNTGNGTSCRVTESNGHLSLYYTIPQANTYNHFVNTYNLCEENDCRYAKSDVHAYCDGKHRVRCNVDCN